MARVMSVPVNYEFSKPQICRDFTYETTKTDY